MSIYRVVTPGTTAGAAGDGTVRVRHVRFAGAMGAAKSARRELSEMTGEKLQNIEIEEVDAKGGKAGFIAYMNAFQTQLPADYEAPGYPKEEKADKSAAKKAAKKPAKKPAKKK